jgi:subtilase family serine protease
VSVTAWAAQPDRIVSPIDNTQTVALKGNVSPKAQPQFDQGPVDPSMKLPFVTLLIQPSADQQAALKQLLAEQQDPSSLNYHKWLTPEQFGQRFGLSNADVAKITHWLRSQGFSVVQVARGRDWVAFSGTVAQVQRAFHTELHRYNLDGEERFANATDPSIPKALDGIVAGFHGLNNFRLEPMNVKKSDAIDIRPDYFSGGGNYLAPGDIATIYDIGPLYTAGIDGTGMKIAIMGQTDIYAVDIAQFRAGFGLSANVPQQILATGCTDPGVTGDLNEADIDLEWSGAVARNATIIFVKCDTTTNNGVITSAIYAIDNDLAPVISMSYGGCESANGQNNALAFQSLVQKANTEGITFLASSGDSGAAACDAANPAAKGLAVNLPASIPEITAVGGTEFNEGSGTYWGTSNGANGGSALSYIPELAWDDNSTGTGFDPGLASTGGGASIYFAKPSWQTGPGVPNNNVRYVPDVAMPASPDHDGYIVCTNNGTCAGGVQNGLIFGGTSVATPIFAGIVTLLNQQIKNTPPAGMGNINTTLYQFAQSMPSAFHDVPAGNYNNGGAANPSGNTVPCTQGTTSCPTKAPFQFGFLTGTGYDQATGLGSVDAHVFVTNFVNAVKIPTTTTVTLSPASVNVGATGPVMAKATVTHATGTGTPTGSVSFYVDGSTTAAGSGTLSGGSFTFSYNPTALTAGNHSITATYGGDSTFAGSTSAGATLGVQDFKIAANPTTVTVTAPGQSGTTTLTITPLGGFSQTVTYTCTGLPSEAACTFPTAATGGTLTITTMPPSARIDKSPLGRSRRLFYALLLPGFLGLVVPAGGRKRTLRRLRLLSLIAVLALSTFWMPACGGGSSQPSNPGTPAGTSSVTVTATAGSLSHSVPVTLIIQ